MEINNLSAGRPRFDSALNAWVLTRYADVLAALRESRLCQISPRTKRDSCIRNEITRLQKRKQVRATLSRSSLAGWQWPIELLAESMSRPLATNTSIDLLHEFIRPWCLAVSAMVSGADPRHRQLLANLVRDLPGGEAECYTSALRSRVVHVATELMSSRRGVIPVCDLAFRLVSQTLQYSILSVPLRFRRRLAKARLDRLLENGTIPAGEAVFLGTSQTLPAFLANAWLALLLHPPEWARLREQPDLMPRAIDELLRYAGIVHTLFRRANADLDLGGVSIRKGERVILSVWSANRDPAQFHEPDRFDLNRRLTSHVALGAGPHSCLGASLVRMAAGIATNALIREFAGAEVSSAVEWYRDEILAFPVSLKVRLRRAPAQAAESPISDSAGYLRIC